jgi:GNAT superfamily N-acetyltransferase
MRDLRLDRDEIRALSAEILARGGAFRFQARGWSMRPFVRDGDVLTVEPPGAVALKVGDVALYAGGGDKLTVHRVVGAEARNGRTVLLMRGDAQYGPVERVSTEQVLGRCVGLQRGDRTLDLDRPAQRGAALLWRRSHPLGPTLLRVSVAATRGVLRLLGWLQASKPYRFLARRWIGGRVGYRVATLHDAAGLAKLYGLERLPEFGAPVKALPGQLAETGERSCTFVALVGERIVGAVGLHRFPDDAELYSDAWLFDMLVQAPYRGAGIGEGLVRAVLERALGEGDSRVALLVFEDNKAAVRLYHKLGFQPASIAGLDERLAVEVEAGHRRRLILARTPM